VHNTESKYFYERTSHERTVLILNPVAGKSRLAETQEEPISIEEDLSTALRIDDIEPEVWLTTLEDPGEGLARKAADDHVDLIIAAGGDGTIHAVASGLMSRESTLGIIPMGTLNNLAWVFLHPSRRPAQSLLKARRVVLTSDRSMSRPSLRSRA